MASLVEVGNLPKTIMHSSPIDMVTSTERFCEFKEYIENDLLLGQYFHYYHRVNLLAGVAWS